MKGSDLLVKCLENEGVEYIFGIPGEETLDLMESISKSSIEFVLTRHEQGAAFMANVYGRLAGKPGVCLATLGPGATNLITGVADAQLDRVPLVAITGQAPLEAVHKESHQYIDVVQTFKFVTEWNRTITKASFIPEMIRKAFKISAAAPGATHLELPED
ncbi:MAG: thiamine pyrophosphate-binding protein, partial [Candidatus Hydrothermarchaeaceae archaeon]